MPLFEEPHRPHIIDDGVGEAEASDHIDSTTGMTRRPDDEPSTEELCNRQTCRDGLDG